MTSMEQGARCKERFWILLLATLSTELSQVMSGYPLSTFWGQDAAFQSTGGGLHERPLLYLCTRDSPYSSIVIGYVTGFSDPSNSESLPGLDLSFHCKNPPDEKHPSLRFCPSIAKDIFACQRQGKRVLIALGGPKFRDTLKNSEKAAKAAGDIWDLYLGGKALMNLRPFGKVKLDGVMLDLRGGQSKNVDKFVTDIKSLMDQDLTDDYIVAVAPSCTYPDTYFGPGTKKPLSLVGSLIDEIIIRYTKGECCFGNRNAFTTSLRRWFKLVEGIERKGKHAPKIKLMVPTSKQPASQECFVKPEEVYNLAKALGKISSFDGFMLWENTWDDRSRENLVTYSNKVAVLLGKPEPSNILQNPTSSAVVVQLKPALPAQLQDSDQNQKVHDGSLEDEKQVSNSSYSQGLLPNNTPQNSEQGNPDLDFTLKNANNSNIERPEADVYNKEENMRPITNKQNPIPDTNLPANVTPDEETVIFLPNTNDDGTDATEDQSARPNILVANTNGQPPQQNYGGGSTYPSRPTPSAVDLVLPMPGREHTSHADTPTKSPTPILITSQITLKPSEQPDTTFIYRPSLMPLNIDVLKKPETIIVNDDEECCNGDGETNGYPEEQNVVYATNQGLDQNDDDDYDDRDEPMTYDIPFGTDKLRPLYRSESHYDADESRGDVEEIVFASGESSTSSASGDGKAAEQTVLYFPANQNEVECAPDKSGCKKTYELRLPSPSNPFGKPNPSLSHDQQLQENNEYLKMLQDDIQAQISKFNVDIVKQQPIQPEKIQVDPNKAPQKPSYPDLEKRHDPATWNLVDNMNLKNNMDHLKSQMANMQKQIDATNFNMQKKLLEQIEEERKKKEESESSGDLNS